MHQQDQRSRVDLHIHSTTSDGILTPSEVVHKALELGLSVIALTDHDSLGGIEEAQSAAADTKLEVIPGVEINSEHSRRSLHFLGYYVDASNPFLQERLNAIQEARLRRAQRIVEKLAEIGLPVGWEEVQSMAGGDSVGRPHIARALLDRGHTTSIREAFNRYIGRDGPAYAPRMRLTPTETIEVIHRSGGLAILAHPAHSGAIDLIPRLVALGLDGLEVHYPNLRNRDLQRLQGLCRQYELLITGGSDFHAPGHEEGVPMGSVFVPEECAAELRRAAGR